VVCSLLQVGYDDPPDLVPRSVRPAANADRHTGRRVPPPRRPHLAVALCQPAVPAPGWRSVDRPCAVRQTPG